MMKRLTFAANASGTEDIWNGRATPIARRTLPESLWKNAQRKLDALSSATNVDDLKCPPGNRLHVLKGDRKGQHALKINDQYRICFIWTEEGASHVEICDYH